ncbi:MAG: type VI secretion system ATPase TssH, partial [Rhabdochlamydiaceae bacterium]
PFLPLQEKDMEAIVILQLKQVRRRLQDRDIQLEWNKPLLAYLAEKGYDPLYGARPLKRLIQNEVVNMLSAGILKGDILPGQTIHLEAKENKDITYRR